MIARAMKSATMVALLLLSLVALADGAKPARYLPEGRLDLAYALPPPPAADTHAARHDLGAVIEAQSARTPETIAAAQADQEVSAFRFADVLGPGFAAARLPLTDAFLQRSCREAATLTAAAKKHWKRPRPPVQSPDVKPVLGFATDGSYPSGHATCGYLWAILLAEIVPEKRDALYARGLAYGRNRVVGGVHFPSDVDAGRLGAAVVAAAFMAEPAFRRDLDAVRTELRAAVSLAPATTAR